VSMTRPIFSMDDLDAEPIAKPRRMPKLELLKASGTLPDTFEQDWQEWISDKIQDTPTTDLVARLFVQRSVGGRPRGKH
jgi:hypothetical protein